MADLGLEDVTEEIDGTLRVMEKRKRFDTNSREYDEFNFQRKNGQRRLTPNHRSMSARDKVAEYIGIT